MKLCLEANFIILGLIIKLPRPKSRKPKDLTLGDKAVLFL